ncbi:MAG: hypothetical protein HQM09_04685 [Candidatus Riflebacteria bacterium]|nr:hypothetical protein [Candidatus Riflebacteria bacterium]
MAQKRSQGVALFLVIGILFVLSIMFFSIHMQSIQLKGATVNLLEEEQAYEIARGCSDIIWLYLEEVFKEHQGCEAFYPTLSTNSALQQFSNGSKNQLSLRLKDFTRKIDIEAAIQNHLNEFSNAKLTLGDNDELFVFSFAAPPSGEPEGTMISGKVEMKIRLGMNKKTSYDFSFPRELKLLNILPPVASKFTLFVHDNTSEERYNIVEKNYQDDSGPQKTLTLFNSLASSSITNYSVYKNQSSGYIFLGGGRVVLNIDGTHPCRRESEAFLFWPLIYQNPTLNLGPADACGPYLGSSKLRVRLTPLGCHKGLNSPDMTNVICRNGSISTLMNSSVLRLFGNKFNMSPTEVYGKVIARYILYSALIYDEDNDCKRDEITDANGTEVMIFPLPNVSQSAYSSLGFDSTLVNKTAKAAFNSFQSLDPKIPFDGFRTLFPAYSPDYQGAMTKISTDFIDSVSCYNAVFDLFFDGAQQGSNKCFPLPNNPSLRRFDPSKDYPNEGSAYIPKIGNNQLSPVDLSTLSSGGSNDPAKGFRGTGNLSRVSHSFQNDTEFLGSSMVTRTGNNVSFDQPMVARIQGNLHFPGTVAVNAPVVLVVSGGNVTFDGNVAANRPDGSIGSLVVWALKEGGAGGDIIANSGAIDALLMAPDGTFTWNNAPLCLNGGLFVKTLNPDDVKINGGAIHYNTGLDPTDPKAWLKNFTVIMGLKQPSNFKK